MLGSWYCARTELVALPWGSWHHLALHKEEEDGGRHGWETHGGVKSLVQEAVEIWWPDPSWVMLLPPVEGGFGQGGAVSGPWSGHTQGDLTAAATEVVWGGLGAGCGAAAGSVEEPWIKAWADVVSCRILGGSAR